ncbi:methyltransferase domain-containing protein [Corallococcus sp. AB032C]|uniref:methyltransferase domain-containing protein n=1 Tax=Corallococcus TaxID=83461 RepID=UPI000EF01B2D|nr:MULTISPECIES: methyltransferase domain-containing protein [Corallococcus]NNB90125.1 methyltransferase domain-containing protein [Corallococcus exiguus]NPC50579.1 methyltransferase domain-containing protein [Corallococcus exiguus]RKH76335.1 methyltransferase domain-containing protein [Corallococcus sp. AB032C]
MLKPEARWLSRQMTSLDVSRLSPLLNVGSSTRHFREVQQPWIHQELFAPWLARGGQVVHQDLKADDGVDVVGSLLDADCMARLEARGIRSVCCTNVLEHVPDPRDFARQLSRLVAPGGVLLLSVPRAFPWHPDPIDTRFRPTVSEVAALFPDLRLVAGEVVPCGTLVHLVAQDLPAAVGRLLRPGRGAEPGVPRESVARWLWPWLVRPFEVTCAVFERP